MENINKQLILDSIETIFTQARGCEIKASFFEQIEGELNILSQYFSTSKNQSFFIAIIFALNFEQGNVSWNDLVCYLNCSSSMQLLKYHDDFEQLNKRGILELERSTTPLRLTTANDQLSIHEKITIAILQNQPLPEIKEEKVDNIIEVLQQVYNLYKQRKREKTSTEKVFKITKKLLHNNSHLLLIKELNKIKLSTEESYLFLLLIHRSLFVGRGLDLDSFLGTTYNNAIGHFNFLQKILSKEDQLSKNNFIKISRGNFLNDPEIELTSTAIQFSEDCEIRFPFNNKEKSNNNNVIPPSKIISRKLFFDEEEMSQIYTLKKLLQQKKFIETQNKLSKKGLPKGITVLLHGVPGTGKTEVVKQLAKSTNREIIQVDISQARSKWFGDSEKIIKNIFTNYKSYASDCKRTPILFFNEADAIISKRIEISSSIVSKVENNIQNILLEEIENFEGILIATTNLVDNLDNAFERRFLFKIPFQKPNTSIQAKIWNTKLPHLKMKDCQTLAERFNFSGGQIDNIVRKSEIEEVLNGETPQLDAILSYCEAELIQKNIPKIGFN